MSTGRLLTPEPPSTGDQNILPSNTWRTETPDPPSTWDHNLYPAQQHLEDRNLTAKVCTETKEQIHTLGWLVEAQVYAWWSGWLSRCRPQQSHVQEGPPGGSCWFERSVHSSTRESISVPAQLLVRGRLCHGAKTVTDRPR